MKRLALLILPLALASCDKLKEVLESGEDSTTGEAVKTLSLNATELSEGEIDAFVARRDQVVVLDFHASWCGPCKNLGPKLDQVAGEFGDKVALGKVDVDQANAAAARFGVSGIPDVRIFVGGREVDRFVGDMPEDQIRARIQPHAAKVSGAAPSLPEAVDTPAGAEPTIQPMKKDWLPPGVERK